MMRFDEVPQPAEWTTAVLEPGSEWLSLATNRDAVRPKDLWSPFREALAAGFRQLCAYTVVWTPNGTVDHYIPWAKVRGTSDTSLAYSWSNLRYSAAWFNSSRRSADVPDPFRIADDWFELLLPSLELVATDRVPQQDLERVKTALQWLGKDERVLKVRRDFFTMYQSGKLSIECLDEWAPLLGRALRKNSNFLLPADQNRLQLGLL